MRVNPEDAGDTERPGETPPGRARVVDIARAAGVSTATVDRVLNRRPGVRDATVQRVLKAAGALDYLPGQALYAALAPPPDGVTRELVLAGNRLALDRWWDWLGIDTSTWWRLLKKKW